MERIVLQPIQSRELLSIENVRPLDDSDFELLKELGDVLRRFSSTDRFGICLLHKHFDLASDEQLLEETDEENRISTVRVRKAQDIPAQSVETSWRFSSEPTAVTVCETRCKSSGFWTHKNEHFKVGR